MAQPTPITITGTCLRPDGAADSGRVLFESSTFVRHALTDDVVAPGVLAAELDAGGDVTLVVPATDDPAWSPVGWTYRVTLELSGGRVTFDAVVPYDSPAGVLDLSELLPAQASGGVLYAPIAHVHDDRYPTEAEMTAADAAVAYTANLAYDAAQAATATADAALPKLAGEVVDSTLTVRRGDNSAGIRLRSSGGAVDFDKMNGDIIVGSFAGPGFTGTQTNLQRWRNNGTTLVGLTEFGTTAYAGEQAIDATAGVAKLGAKNGLSNIQLAGRRATAGAPTTGTWATGDEVHDSAGIRWLCTTGGTPGTWTSGISGAQALALSHSPAAGVVASLYRGQSTVIQLIGDSTGVGTTAWFGRLGSAIAAANPSYNVLFRAWNAATQWYDMPSAIQAGPSGDSRITMSGSCAVRHVAASITGDIDLRVRIAPTLWNKGSVQALISKWVSTGNQRSFWFGLSTTGVPVMTWTTDGTLATQVQVFATAGMSGTYPDAQPRWLRVTVDVDNGAAGRTTTFYTSADGVTWSMHGTAVTTAGVTSIFDAASAPYQAGALDSSIGSTFAGDLYWAEARNGIDGVSLVPPLADTWDQATGASTNTVLRAGSPTVLLVAGSETGQTVAYWDNATRRPKVASAHNAKLLILSTNHNEGVTSDQAFIAAYDAWVGNLRTLLPDIPVVTLTQNPQKSPRSTSEIAVHASRGAALAAWSLGNPNVTAIDTYRVFTDVANQVGADGVHPTASGYQAWGDYVYTALLRPGLS